MTTTSVEPPAASPTMDDDLKALLDAFQPAVEDGLKPPTPEQAARGTGPYPAMPDLNDPQLTEQQRQQLLQQYEGKQMERAAAALTNSLVIAPLSRFADNVRHRKQEDLVRRVKAMYRDTVDLQTSVQKYNEQVRAADPELFERINAFAKDKKIKPEDMLHRVLDTGSRDPDAVGLRDRMADLASRPEFKEERDRLDGVARGLDKNASEVSTKLGGLKVDPDTMERIHGAISNSIERRAKSIDPFDAEAPSDSPGGLKKKIDETMKELSERVTKMVEALVEKFKNAFGVGGPAPK